MSTATKISIVIGVALVFSLGGCDDRQDRAIQTLNSLVDISNRERVSYPPPPRRSIADREKWNANAFFASENELEICETISSGNTKQLAALLESGAELNTSGKFGFTVLYWAFVEAEVDAFELLLEHGADPDQRLTDFFRWSPDGVEECSKKSSNRFTPFDKGDSVLFTSLRCWRGQFLIAAVEHTDDINQQDRSDNSLLNVVLSPGCFGNPKIVEVLIGAGIDVNSKNSYGSTPCHQAIEHPYPEVLLQLFKAGADLSVQDSQGRDVADFFEAEFPHLPKAILRDHHFVRDNRYDLLTDWFAENYREIHPTQESLPNAGESKEEEISGTDRR